MQIVFLLNVRDIVCHDGLQIAFIDRIQNYIDKKIDYVSYIFGAEGVCLV